MELTNEQENALKVCINRYKNHEAYTVVAGFAGSGKTTLMKFLVEALDLMESEVAFIAFTGKAALVLQNKGCPGAITAHRLLYDSKQKKDGTFYHIPKEHLPLELRLIIVDEVSMIPGDMWDLLLTHNIPVVACGDPGQLPPITSDNEVLKAPHVFLKEIHRQAQESEIIRLSMDIRANKPIKPFKGTEVNIVRQRDVVTGMYDWADQIICGKNATRHSINNFCRQRKWGDIDLTKPLVGDKVVCLRNNWDITNPAGDALVNGMTGEILGINTMPDLILKTQCRIDFVPDYYNDTITPFQVFDDIAIDWKLITEGEPTINKDNFAKFPKGFKLELFDYAYAMTCHKSQGSEYPKVLLFEEFLSKDEHARWLYTGVTRASEKLTLVLANS